MTASPPRVLVVVASRHGGTEGIAEALARELGGSPAGRAAGLTAVVLAAQRQPDPGSFDAVLIASAVYAGRWLDAAREYATHYVDRLRSRPVWLFSSGPIGAPPFPPDQPHDAVPLTALTGAREHRSFAGRLEPSRLSVGERAMVTAMRAPVGDFRDWDATAAWAAEIAIALTAPVPAGQR
jgi:menaquinone-dependent protoporphyrinogen oxidase